MTLQPTKRLFTVDEYYRMAEAGILGEDDRVELIEGEIIQTSPIGPHHADEVDYLTRLFFRRVGDLAQIRIQNPVRLSDRSEPQPDLALLRSHPERDRPYVAAHPTPADVLLMVEVAESSVAYDLGRKARVYARHGIAELWVLDLRQDRLVVFRDPTPRGYAGSRILGRGESISSLAFPDITFAVDEILG
jgi:Uma2 family endonuclease